MGACKGRGTGCKLSTTAQLPTVLRRWSRQLSTCLSTRKSRAPPGTHREQAPKQRVQQMPKIPKGFGEPQHSGLVWLDIKWLETPSGTLTCLSEALDHSSISGIVTMVELRCAMTPRPHTTTAQQAQGCDGSRNDRGLPPGLLTPA